MVSWAASEGGWPAETSLLHPQEAPSGVLHPDLRHPATGRCRAAGAGPEEGYKDDQRAGVLLL